MSPKVRLSVFLGFVAFVWPGAMPSYAEPVRLAIVPKTEALRAAADFLTVALSTNAQVALVERAQLEKVLREQEVAASNRGNLIKLGELLGADGLLVLQLPEG